METRFLIYFYFIFSICASQEFPCSKFLSVDISGAAQLPNKPGVFLKDNITYDKNNYFIDGGRRWGCICNIKKCIRKCCDQGTYMSENKTCSTYNGNFTINFYNDIEPNYKISINDFFIIIGSKCLEGYVAIQADSSKDIFIQENGSLFNNAFEALYSLDNYCIDVFKNEISAFLCEAVEEDEQADMQRQVNGIGLLISMPFLFATFLTYVVLPERSLHRRALICYVINALAANISLVTIQLYPDEIPKIPCHILGYLIIFFFLVSFFWLNAMCVDMWLAFSSLTGFLSKKTGETKKFVIYSIYAWGLPTFFVILVLLLNTYGDEEANYHPNLGYRSCFLTEGLPTFYYFYLPMAVIVGINIVLFVTTSLKIFKIKKETKMLKRSNSRIHNSQEDVQKFNLYLKLMFAMGVNWIMEFISWAVIWKYEKAPRGIFYVTDFTNAMYGFLIFFIFVFKKKVWRSLRKRYYTCIGKPHLAPSTSARSGRASGYSTETVVSTCNSPSKRKSEEIPLNNK